MAKRKNKQNKLMSILIAVVIIIILVGVGYYVTKNYDFTNKKKEFISDEVSIHFLELGNQYTGDCVFVKAGDTDLLIDAGSRTNSATTIGDYLKEYVQDGKLEYVIATHAHQDHIAGFVGDSKNKGIFEQYDCETIIDFPMTESSSAVYKNYVAKRDQEIEQGAKHYTALECYNETNGGKKIYQLSDGIELEILYNYYYENDASTENNYSVCVMINQGDRHFLFTGDLEEAGEKKLIQKNQLPEVEVFKAGHHGSYTASSIELLNVIKPKMVCVCCCCGSDEYTDVDDNMFPSQAFISRICKFTDKVYVTSIINSTGTGYGPMNGNIMVVSNKTAITVNCSNNNVILKDTEWFKNHREWN